MGSSETAATLEVIQRFEKSTKKYSECSRNDGINILVTGFGPFRDHIVNASWEAVKLINPDEIPWPKNIPTNVSLNVTYCQLEVAYNTVSKHVPDLWEKNKPHLTIHVGVSGIAKAITLERFAHNLGYCSPDTRDCLPQNNKCIEGGFELLQSGFDMENIVKKLNNVCGSTGIRAELSTDPGRFLCDFTYYQSLHINKERTAFIHVPPVGKPFTAEEMALAIQICISEFLYQLQQKCLLL